MKINHSWQLIGVALITLIVTVITLDKNGYLRHSSEEDSIYLAEFNLIKQSTESTETKLSHIPADYSAQCVQGVLLLHHKKQKDNVGVLVDRKQRAVRC
ncbi:hypothetical protein KCM76_06955 [Zooshikella marina]|uniref:Uncharacterized protein n=1 Tax=Zooshikella ganghwensis TaxID=202772 RepID=A0A4P9VR52_9GAMM|nr:hypothetical protein [Zooshikella ganghwensis]MBU2705713.1 hypothetical protein [Zooshikella ganghwensis]RDH45087.1 hypothetical protein B9G39_17505 [Zooshikella ganghwensis]